MANGNESERLEALARYDILDTPPDGTFDRITELLAKVLDVPVAIVSLVDRDRIWFKSHKGVEIDQVGRDPGLCASAILGDGPYIVNNLRVDPRTLANPVVASDFGFQFYAAVPLQTRDHYNLGTLCCLDYKPRELTAEQVEILRTLGQIVMDEMELRRSARQVDDLNSSLVRLHEELRDQATHDALTGLWNRKAILEALDSAYANRDRCSAAVLMIDVDHFKPINDRYGHGVGDQVLVEVAARLRRSIGVSAVGRLGGEEFLGVLENCGVVRAQQIAEECRAAVHASPVRLARGNPIEVSISLGLVLFDHETDLGMGELLHLADAEMYRSKQQGRNRVSCRVLTGEPANTLKT